MIDERHLSLHQEEKGTTKSEEDAAATTKAASESSAAAIKARSTLPRSKSVSFYSQVSVFEFFVCSKFITDEQRSQEGWSKYFTT